MRLVAIGGSAGSLDALRALLGELPATPPAALAVVIHLSPGHASLLESLLGGYTALGVREAVDKLPLEPGTLTIAPPDYHLLIERGATVALSRDPAVHFSRPAIDPLFESAAAAFGDRTIGVLLSGANEDGAAGLREIAAAGGLTAVQDPATAPSPEMPRAALALLAPDVIGPPAALGRWLRDRLETDVKDPR